MKTEEHDSIVLISGYLDNALSPEETERLLEIIRKDPSAADFMCELSIQHVQLRRLFKKDEATAPRRDLSVEPVFSRFVPAWRPLAIAAGLAIIVAAGFRLTGFLRERDASRAATIVLLKVGQDLEDADAKRAEAAAAGATVIVPAGTIGLLRFKDETIFELEAGTTAQIVDTGSATSGKTIKLMAGTVIADVASQPVDFPLCLTTPHAEIIVVGTRLACKAEHDHTHVRMHEGWAHVIHHRSGEKLKLETGQHVTAGERFHFRVRSIHEGEH